MSDPQPQGHPTPLASGSPNPPPPALDRAAGEQAARDLAKDLLAGIGEFERLFRADQSSPDVLHRFMEERLRSLVEERIAPKRLLAGTTTSPSPVGETQAALIEGLIHDPRRGAPALERGRFAVLRPETCVGAIQFKASVPNLPKFEARLVTIQQNYLRHRPPGSAMGIVFADDNAKAKSVINRKGRTFPAFEFTHPKWCPVFILFSRRNREYDPHLPAIRAMLMNLSRL